MDEAEQCDRILFMDKGSKIIEGRPKVLKETTPGAHNDLHPFSWTEVIKQLFGNGSGILPDSFLLI